MIQRVQSIYLFLAALALASLFVLPLATSDTVQAGFLTDRSYTIQDHMALLILTVAGILFSVAAIFLFNNRKNQKRIVSGVMLISLLLLAGFYFLYQGDTSLLTAFSSQAHLQAGLFVPVTSLVFGFLANRAIRKDEQLVKSMDRLR